MGPIHQIHLLPFTLHYILPYGRVVMGGVERPVEVGGVGDGLRRGGLPAPHVPTERLPDSEI